MGKDKKLKCKKCGSEWLNIEYVESRKLIDSSYLGKKIDTDFLSYSEFEIYTQVKSKKEHLRIVCKRCGFKWRKDTEDNEKDS